jgi:hypothetical protein
MKAFFWHFFVFVLKQTGFWHKTEFILFVLHALLQGVKSIGSGG